MATNLVICELDAELKAKIETFRFRKEKNNAAIVCKIDMEKHVIHEDTSVTEELEDFDSPTIEDVAGLLPAHQPRYVLYSYVLHHDDGRLSYPLCFIFISPSGSKPEMHMMYAGSKLHFTNEIKMSKVFEVRSLDEVTEDWLKTKLAFFK